MIFIETILAKDFRMFRSWRIEEMNNKEGRTSTGFLFRNEDEWTNTVIQIYFEIAFYIWKEPQVEETNYHRVHW